MHWPASAQRADETSPDDTSPAAREARPGAEPTAPHAALQLRLERAKHAFVTRRVRLGEACGLSSSATPRAGDLMLATVTEIGNHARLELPSGRRAQLHVGDEIILAYGTRYAPDQFEAVVPADLGACHLAAAGGIAARVVTRHTQTKRPTLISPQGILLNGAGEALNLRQFALMPCARPTVSSNVIAVVGTSMNAGKTTLAASLIRGLSCAGVRVGACKVTGTGSGGDLWSMIDAGAVRALDFTDAGYATTAGVEAAEVEAIAHLLVSRLQASEVDAVVVEIADGLLQRETAALLDRSTFAPRIDALFLAAADSMGAQAGVEWLRARKLPLRAVSGLLTASPLAAREAAEATGANVVNAKALSDPALVASLCLQASPLRGPRSMVS